MLDRTKQITEFRQKRAALVDEIRKLEEPFVAGTLSADDKTKLEKMETEERDYASKIAMLERQEQRERELAQDQGRRVEGGAKPTEEEKRERETKAFRSFVIHGLRDMPADERRDLAADTASAGGNIVAPQQFVQELLKEMDNLVLVRQFARKFTLGSFANLGVPTLTGDVEDADWTTEVQAVDNDTALQFGKRTMAPNILSKLVKVSMKLLEVSTLPAEAIVRERLAYKFAVTQEKAFLTGTGTGQPLGLFVASASGISTGRDYSTGNTTTAIAADNILGHIYNLKAPYRSKARWLFNRDAVRQVRLLKEATTNQYLWQPGLAPGQPDSLAGYPVLESEYVPNTFTTGLYVGLFGDLSKYWVVDQLPYTVQRLVELYAGTNQVGFIGRMSTDGAPVDEKAFSRVKLA